MATISQTSLQTISDKFVTPQGDLIPYDAIAQAPVVLYFVGAKWCPHSQKFTEELKKFYTTINEKEKKLEIVYFSVDASEGDFKAQMSEFPWAGVPFDNNPQVRKFLNEREITVVPSVLLVRKEDGKVLKTDCRGDIHKNPTGCFNDWVTILHEVSFEKHSNVNESKISHKSMLK